MPHSDEFRLVLNLFLCHLRCIGKLHEHASHLSAASFQFEGSRHSLLLFRIVYIDSDNVFVVLCLLNKRLTTLEIAYHFEEAGLNPQKTHCLIVCLADRHFVVIFQICFIDFSHWSQIFIFDAVPQNKKPYEGGLSGKKTTDHLHTALSLSSHSFPLFLEILLLLFFTLFLQLATHLALCGSCRGGGVNFLQIYII